MSDETPTTPFQDVNKKIRDAFAEFLLNILVKGVPEIERDPETNEIVDVIYRECTAADEQSAISS